MKAKTSTKPSRIQIITLVLASFAVLLGALALYFAIITLQSQESISESLATGSHENTVKIYRMHTCIEENINPCNIDNLALPPSGAFEEDE